MASDRLCVAALSRPFTLGMLYDAVKDEVIPGLTLWDIKTLQQNTVENRQPSSAFEVSASDSIESKSSQLDIEASLKASFLSGLVEVEGSAKYLNDTKKFKNQSRVTCRYKATTNFKQLLMTDLVNLDDQQQNVIKKSTATHVVTGILYGANAFFVFDSEKLDASSVQEMEGSMKAVINKIPSFDVGGKVEMKLTTGEEALTKKFSCKFYGDLHLESNPATFEDAVKTYAALPKLVGEKGESSVPLKVWMMPLRDLYSEAAELKSTISIGLVRKVEDTLQDLRETEMRCNDSLTNASEENFPQISKKLLSFQKLCGYYVSNLQRTMAKKFPLIREGKEDESSVKQLFEDGDKSPLSKERLSRWLDHKEREINVINSCIAAKEGIKIVPNQTELDREVLAPGVEDAFCFVFTSLEIDDPCLDAMTRYLDSRDLERTDEEPWYYSDEVLANMRALARRFNIFAKVMQGNPYYRFLIAAIADEKYTGATIYHYKDGRLTSTMFAKPDIDDVNAVTDRKTLIWYACDLTLDPNTANNCLTLSEDNKRATYGERQKYPDDPERFEKQPQALCKDGLDGRHYWEVEWSQGSKESVYVAAAYKGIQRKGSGSLNKFGCNTISWCFGLESPNLCAYYDGQVWKEALPSTGCSRVGVFLDWPAGTLSFYRVCADTLIHLYTFNTTFTEPLYPGVRAKNKGNYVDLCPFYKEQ
ncbi:stonustoxin subunit beta-like [Pempheris klunzingeri]|uniref:stonustoxin subunit beta-like n=1 Tax=Pempheris klunzingeri TaxID=3127111 RepID=UPI003981634B